MLEPSVIDGLEPGTDGVDRFGLGAKLVTVVEPGLEGGLEVLDLTVVPVRAGTFDRQQRASPGIP